MHKIKIISNGLVIKPKEFDNIDVSLGISYYSSVDEEVKTIENDWGFKVLSKISQITQIMTSKLFSNKEIVDQILEDSRFVLKQQEENADNLHIQINQNTVGSNVLNFLTAFNILKRINYLNRDSRNENLDKIEDVLFNLGTELAHIHPEEKKMFLGTSLFEKKNSLYKKITQKFTKKDTVSFVFYHEYSHSSELMNNEKYGNESIVTNTSFDNLKANLSLLNDSEKYIELSKKLRYSGNSINLPNRKMVCTLHVLYKEMYADIGSLLLMRNKAIHDGTYNQEKWKELIKSISDVRKEDKKQTVNIYEENKSVSFMSHEHFTSPGMESLFDHAEKIEKNKMLTEKEIHEITIKCVQEGMSKVVLTMIEADNYLVPQFNTLFSLRLKNKDLEVDNSKNHYLESVNKMKECVLTEWKDNLKTNVQKVLDQNKTQPFNIVEDAIFDAGLDYEYLHKRLNEHKEPQSDINMFNKAKNNINFLRDKYFKKEKSLKNQP